MSTSILNTALSVTELTSYLQDLLESDRLLQQVWVKGEISSVHDHSRGLFFTLSDPEAEATVNCVIWNSQRSRLAQEPQIGEQMIILGRISLYPKRGDYKINVFQALSAGEGLQALKYQQLLSRLEAEGLFDITRKRPLPLYPQIIAIVTSPTAAAWGDIKRTLSQRYPGLHLLLSPAIVQGIDAPASIVAAIERVNQDQRAEVLILARGGGAVEDLSCFNDEKVARAIANSQIPVITGIGHQRDQCLADLVADVSVHTPTAAAEKVVPDYQQLIKEHQERMKTLITVSQQRFTTELKYLEKLSDRLKNIPVTSRVLSQAHNRCQLFQEKLIALDPQAVVKRGYAVVRQTNGQIIRSTIDVKLDQELTIELGSGKLKVKIIEVL
jgi:exodeoxyribonuclease VII large subunit